MLSFFHRHDDVWEEVVDVTWRVREGWGFILRVNVAMRHLFELRGNALIASTSLMKRRTLARKTYSKWVSIETAIFCRTTRSGTLK